MAPLLPLAAAVAALVWPAAAAASAPASCTEVGCGARGGSCSCEATCYSSANCCADFETACPKTAPIVRLGDINMVVTTDLHSWVEGRAHQPYLNASLGHAVSLVERLRAQGRLQGRDVFFFDNGDVNDGTGLSATAQDHVDYLAPLLRLAGYDALNVGNHELYQLNAKGSIPGEACAITGLRDAGYINAWQGRYLSSNIVWASSSEPVGSRYTTLVGAFGTRLLVFGFLYNMDDHCDAVVVEDVATVVSAPWFQDALRDHAATSDAIVVLAHMDYRDELVDVILAAIRATVGPRKPVQFLTGHSHIRGFRQLDDFASSYEAGCKMDTVGFIALDTAGAGGVQFQHADMDGNSAHLALAANSSEATLLEPHGQALVGAIAAARQALGLQETLGCSDRQYRVSAAPNASDSLWRYYMGQVLPAAVFQHEGSHPQWAIVGNGALTYDIYEGPFTKDDAYKASPYGNFFFSTNGVPGERLQLLLERLNGGSGSLGRRLRSGQEWAINVGGQGLGAQPAYFSVGNGPLEPSTEYELIYCDFDGPVLEALLENITGEAVHRQIYRPGSNTSSVLVEWFQGQPCGQDPRPTIVL